MRQWSVFRENWPYRRVSQRCWGLIVYETVVLLLASGLVWAREAPKPATTPAVPAAFEILTSPRGAAGAASDSAPTLPVAATAPSASVRGTAPETNQPAGGLVDPVSVSSATSAAKRFAFHQGWRFWAGVAVVASGIGVGVYALTAGGPDGGFHSHLGAKAVF